MATMSRPAVPAVWKNVMALVTLGKATVAGVGLGIAALGIVDVTTVASIKLFVSEVTHNRALDVFAYGGGAIGFVWRLAMSVLR